MLPLSNIGRGNGGAGTYSLGITVMNLCFGIFQHNLSMVVVRFLGLIQTRMAIL